VSMKRRICVVTAVVALLATTAAFAVNEYYAHVSGAPATGSQASSATMRAEFDAVKGGFDLLPTLSANGDKAIFVNSGGTALTALDAATARTKLGAVASSGGTLSGTTNLSGGQIKFPSTQSASADPNTLDDYAEGTFTPGITFGGASTGITYTIQTGDYTKVGRLVVAHANILLSNKGSATGAALITGLPFTVNTSAFVGAAQWSSLNTNWVNVIGLASNGTTQVIVYGATAAGTGNQTQLANTDFTNSTNINVTLVYFSAT
jgi:hypothetical protein